MVLNLPNNWIEIPKDKIDTAFQAFSEINDTEYIKFDFGFQLQKNEGYFTFPYILISIQDEERVPEEELNVELFNKGIIKGAQESSLIDINSLEVGDSVFDKENNRILTKLKSSYNGTNVICYMDTQLFSKGYVNIYIYSLESEIKNYENLYTDIINGVYIRPNAQYIYNDQPLGISTKPIHYNDTNSGVSFTVPAGWEQADFIYEKDILKVKYVCSANRDEMIMYGYVDIWDNMSDDEKSKYKKSDIGASFFTKADIADMYEVPISSVTTIVYEGVEYYYTDVLQGANSLTNLVYIHNGILYQFMYGCRDNHNEHYSDFEFVMNSVIFPQAQANKQIYNKNTTEDLKPTADKYDIGNLFVSLIGTIIIYSLPIIIYRYWVRRKPIRASSATKIAIVYGIFSFILMSILLYSLDGKSVAGGAIIFWSYFNYYMLKSGRDKTAFEKQCPEEKPIRIALYEERVINQEVNPDESIEKHDNKETLNSIDEMRHLKKEDSVGVIFCRNCGSEIPLDSKFCYKCGMKVMR